MITKYTGTTYTLVNRNSDVIAIEHSSVDDCVTIETRFGNGETDETLSFKIDYELASDLEEVFGEIYRLELAKSEGKA